VVRARPDGVLWGFGALILWEGAHEIGDIHERFNAFCEQLHQYQNCGGNTDFLLPIFTMIAAVAAPIGLSELWKCPE